MPTILSAPGAPFFLGIGIGRAEPELNGLMKVLDAEGLEAKEERADVVDGDRVPFRAEDRFPIQGENLRRNGSPTPSSTTRKINPKTNPNIQKCLRGMNPLPK
jgi:hypothetical protein